MANRADPEKNAPLEQSGQVLLCLSTKTAYLLRHLKNIREWHKILWISENQRQNICSDIIRKSSSSHYITIKESEV